MKGNDPLTESLERLQKSPRDEAAWKQLITKLWPFVMATILRRLGKIDRALAEDAAQEVFTRLVSSRAIAEVRDPQAFRGYVWKIADNVAKDLVRGVYRKYLFERPFDNVEDKQLVQIATLDQQEFISKHEIEKLKLLLSENERSLLGHLLQDRSVGEIAEILGQSYSNIGTRCYRLRNRLRRIRKNEIDLTN